MRRARSKHNRYLKKNISFKPNSKGEQLHSEYQHSTQHDQHGWRNPCFDFEQTSDSQSSLATATPME